MVLILSGLGSSIPSVLYIFSNESFVLAINSNNLYKDFLFLSYFGKYLDKINVKKVFYLFLRFCKRSTSVEISSYLIQGSFVITNSASESESPWK